MNMKKICSVVLLLAIVMSIVTGCNTSSKGFEATKDITVVSRENGSGTRGAFIELFGIEYKDASGKKIDKTTDESTISNSTSTVMTTVAGNKYAIGYISLGSLNSTVKALTIDGSQATAENVKNKSYKISRPFNIATKSNISDVSKDFINFILSSDGQSVVEKAGYITVSTTGAYNGNKPSGKIVVAGSSSVTPVMEKLKEAYLAVNTNATIEIQQSDSTTGMTSAVSGTCDIGMASRELKDSEKAKLASTVIALDGIAVIVNKENPVSNLKKEQVKSIFTGEYTTWDKVK
jgi:phosphate transport system substrate-binding protein